MSKKRNRFVKDEKFDPDVVKEGDLTGMVVPEYTRKAPWYFNTGEGVEHHRIASWAKRVESTIDQGHKHGPAHVEATKWRPGCCKNCGSDQHREADCTERPRKVNAIARGEGIRSGKVVKKERLSYDAKRDNFADYSNERWLVDSKQINGYASVVRADAAENYNPQIEIRETFGARSSRNRQDVAGYIKAIDNKKPEILVGAEDKFVRSIEAEELQKRKPAEGGVMTWEVDDLVRQKLQKADEIERMEQANQRDFNERQKLLKKFIHPEDILEEVIPTSTKYADIEDVFINGHSSVWGSFFCGGEWGYACCKQTNKHSICTAQKE